MSLWCHSAFQSQHILEAVQQWHSKMWQGPISTSLTCTLGSTKWIMAADGCSPQRTAPRDTPDRILSLFCGRTSAGGHRVPPPPHLSSQIHPPFTQGPCVGCCSRFTPCLVSQSVGMFWQHVKVFGCQWDKVNSAEVLKKILKVHSLSSILLSRREYGWSRQRTMGRHWGRSYSENCVVIRQLFWSKSPLEINILWCITAINFVSSK